MAAVVTSTAAVVVTAVVLTHYGNAPAAVLKSMGPCVPLSDISYVNIPSNNKQGLSYCGSAVCNKKENTSEGP